MTDHWTDDELMDELQAALREAEDVPAEMRRVGVGLYAWRTIDAELADLVLETTYGQDEELVRSRSVAAVRSVTVRASWLDIEMDIEDEPPALRGRVIPRDRPTPAEVVVEGPSRPSVAVPVDDFGYFVVEPFDRTAGSFRLRCADVVTPWFD